jgi:RNA polymerase sigma-70 factor, ECF subfamily
LKLLQNEEKTVSAAANGDERAFQDIFQAYRKPVYHFIYRMLGCAQDAADTTQEVFYKMYQRLSTLKDPEHFSTWLFSIAKNEAISTARRLKRHRERIESTDVYENPTHAPLTMNPDIQLLNSEFEAIFQQQLLEIPETYRAAFILGVLEEKPYDEVAQILNCSVGNVKSRVFRARMHLAKKIARVYIA